VASTLYKSIAVSLFHTVFPFVLLSNFTCVELDQHCSIRLHLFQRYSEAKVVQ